MYFHVIVSSRRTNLWVPWHKILTLASKSSTKTKTCKCCLLECTQTHVRVNYQHVVSFVHFSGHKFQNLGLVVLYFHLKHPYLIPLTFSPHWRDRSKEKCPGFLSARFRKLYDSRSTWRTRWGKGKLDCSSFIPTHKRIVQGAKINHAHPHASANHFLGLLNLIWGKRVPDLPLSMEGFRANFQIASELPNLTNLLINIPSKSALDKHGWICAASVVRTSQVCVPQDCRDPDL